MVRQEAFGGYDHDSLQYHFFAGGLIGAARLFRTDTLEHASFWLFDGRELQELRSVARLERGNGATLDTRGEGIHFVDDDGTIVIRVAGRGDRGESALQLRPRRDFRWSDTIATVIHQPDMDVSFTHLGARHVGIGYCKRYTWTPTPHHWGYRFVQGYNSAHDVGVWTAEATFGVEKYDYFRMFVDRDEVHEAVDDNSRHRKNAVIAQTPLGKVEITLGEVAVWQAPLVSSGMDSLLRQRVCRLTMKVGGQSHDGWAINETCYGTLG